MESAGFDPYDALRGLRVPAFARRHARLRQVIIQTRKRCPIDLSRLLGVTPFPMAKSLGAQLTAAGRQSGVEVSDSSIQALADTLLDNPHIARLAGGAWGYEFDVQTRWAFYAAGSPNIISTYFVARGFAEAWASGSLPSGLEHAEASARFMGEFLSSPQGHFVYTLESNRLVHNANLLGAGVVAAMGVLMGDSALVAQGLRAARTSLAAQASDGSWAYGEGSGLSWSDNFHTAYDLDGLLLVWLATGDEDAHGALLRGARFWVDEFFEPNGAPRYYASHSPGYPHDIHSAGTAIDVAARLASWGVPLGDLPERVAVWTRANLIAPDGSTWYQRHRFWTDRRHFVRWGDAHWALGLSSLAVMEAGRRSPLEVAVVEARGLRVSD